MHRQKKRFSPVLAILFLALPYLAPTNPAMAQGHKCTITGHVTDSSNGVLQGAQVTLDPPGVNVFSDTQGQFFINDLDPGSYTLTIT